MRERLSGLLLPALALSLVANLGISAVAAAQAGRPATVSMDPQIAGPGDLVEVTGRDFPRDMTVVLELVTSTGLVTLATVATNGSGAFRDQVTFPTGLSEGRWSLSARSADGVATSSYTFETGDPASLPAGAGALSGPAAPAAGDSLSDKLVLVIIAVLLGAVATGGLFAWRTVEDEHLQPGMGAGDDLIWGGRTASTEPELTASSEPYWADPVVDADDESPASATTSTLEDPTSATRESKPTTATSESPPTSATSEAPTSA